MTVRSKFGFGLLATLMLSVPSAYPATAAKLDGSIAGFVRNANGVPQMGATVLLYNRYERLVERAITNERGIFGFDALVPENYSVRVTLASFMPAVRQKIAVQPGMQSLLYVDLSHVLSAVELVYAAPGQGALMSDDWKWALKVSTATRPILRLLPDFSGSDPSKRDHASGSIFSDTRGVVKVSAGDPGSLGGTSSQTDLGTAFALETSVNGHNQFQVSGNVGYNARGGMPAAGFRTSFSRDGIGPEIALTMQQVYLPARAGLSMMIGQADGIPALRTVSLSLHDHIALSDRLRLDYGMSLDSVYFLDRLNYMSKFARINYSLGDQGTVRLAYSSGTPPVQAVLDDRQVNVPSDIATLGSQLAALSLLPRLSLLDGRTTVQRSQEFELGYEKKIGSTTVNLTAYRETVTNAAMTIVAPDEFGAGEILPDISSKSSILNAGSYQRLGYTATVTHSIGQRVELGTSVGRGGALALTQQDSGLASADDLRSKLHTTERFWASARAAAKMPVTGTQISASYQWMDYSAMMPSHVYLTQGQSSDAGLNIRLRQPIPSFLGMPGHLEATAELRNMMAQGYLSVTEGGQRVLLIQSPRAVRGGLSFIF